LKKSLATVPLDDIDISDTALNMVEMEKTLESLKEYAGRGNFSIDFVTDKETDSLIIRVIDRNTGETLRQIPPEQILSLRSHMREIMSRVFDHMA